MNNGDTKHATVVRTHRGLSIAGTRITLYSLLDCLKSGWPPHLIRDWFGLTDEQMQDILLYIETYHDEVESEYSQVLAYADEIRHYWEERNRERIARVAHASPPPGKEQAWAKLQQKKAILAHT